MYLHYFELFFIKWFKTHLKLDYLREVGLGKVVGGFERGLYDCETAYLKIKEVLGKENIYLSVATYEEGVGKAKYPWLFYDFDSENAELSIRKGLEFANSLRERYGIEPVIVKSGFKGVHIVIPLKELIDFETYKHIWHYLTQPYKFNEVLDKQVCDPRRLQRVPYTHNIKVVNGGVVRRFSYIVDRNLKPVKQKDFDWSLYEPLNPNLVPKVSISINLPKVKEVKRNVSAVRLVELPKSIEGLINHDAVPPCVKALIDSFVKVGDLDHDRRLVLVWFLKWCGYSANDVINFFRNYGKDFKERITRYQVEYAFGLRGSRKNWVMPSCRWLKERGICLSCGWGKNPITYTYKKASVNPEVVSKFFKVIKSEG